MGFSLGKVINSLTGQSASAKQQASLQSGLNREMAQNYHQWEMQDLEKAGLNPALTLGDISGGGSAGGASTGQPAFNPFDIINSAVSAYTAKKQGETGDTQGALNLATAGKVIAETEGIPQQIKNDTIRALASQTEAQSQKAQTTENIHRSKTGRLSEFGAMGRYVNDWITNSLKPKKYNSAKKQHWYGIRKDGK